MNNKHQPYTIDPETLYTLAGIAEILETDCEWIKREMIYPRIVRHRKLGEKYFILGKWLIDWARTANVAPKTTAPPAYYDPTETSG